MDTALEEDFDSFVWYFAAGKTDNGWGVYEVYVDSDGSTVATEEPIVPWGTTFEDLKEELEQMLKDISTFPPIATGRENEA